MKLYVPDSSESTLFGVHLSFWSHFLLDKDKWTFVNEQSDADVLIVLLNDFKANDFSNLILAHQVLLVILLESDFASCKLSMEEWTINKHEKTIFVCTDAGCNDLRYIFYDIMFNRHKLFYIDYDMYAGSLRNHFWSPGTYKESFILSVISKNLTPESKSFLIPNRIRYDQTYFHNDVKIKLDEFIKNNLDQQTYYYGNPFAPGGIYLLPDGYRGSQSLREYFKTLPWLPIGNHYYNTSYVTICIESHCNTFDDFDTFFSPSEKYFDPFIKGNFTLIFSAPFTIRNLKKYYDFKFPDWIDYSYDDIVNFDDRLESYFNSIKKLSQLSLTELHQLYLKDKHILDHNRNVFFTRPYDSLYDKVKKNLIELDWIK